MRVAVFTDADLDAINGTTRTLSALIKYAPPDVSPRVYSYSAISVDARDYFVTSPGGFYWSSFRSFLRQLRNDNVRVIHTTSMGPAGIAARYLAFRTGLPLVGSVHTTPSHTREPVGRWSTFLRSSYRQEFFRGCRCVLVPSAAAKVRLPEDPETARSIVWPRGVDSDCFSPCHRSSQLREDWHVSDRRPAIMVVGRLTHEKGAALIKPLRSWLHDRRIAHRFIVVGEGPMRAEVSATCPDACCLGKVAHRDLPAVLASADVLLYPTDSHGGCTALLEAQASGLPVVVSSASNAREHMRAGATGYVCRAADISDFGTRLAELLVDRDHRHDMGQAGRRFAETQTWTGSLDLVYTLYRNMDAASLRGAPSFMVAHMNPK